jgi:TPP-dependent pyruvate/acetoin dehydrogenase alpha subunit
MRCEPRVAMTFFGEGSTANGQWHEAMNFAGIHRLPIVFILENNRFAYSTPNELEFAVDPVQRAAGYGFSGVNIDGNDVEAVFEAAHAAVERARDGGGPTLIECQTMRMHGHGAHDDMSYVPDGMLEEWEKRDPIERYAARLASELGFAEDEVTEIREQVRSYVAECAEKALASPMPDPAIATDGVFAERWEPLGDGEAPWSRWDQSGSDSQQPRSNGAGRSERVPETGREAARWRS